MTDLEKFEELFKSVGVGYSNVFTGKGRYIRLDERCFIEDGEEDIEIGVDFDFNLDGSFKGVDVG